MTFSFEIFAGCSLSLTLNGQSFHKKAIKSGLNGLTSFYLCIRKGRQTRRDKSPRLVPATSRGHKSHRVNWPFSLENLVAVGNFGPCDQSHEFKPVGIFGTSPFHLLLKTLRVNCSRDTSLRTVPSCKLFRGLVAGTSTNPCVRRL